jgi:general secretion pathway protein D
MASLMRILFFALLLSCSFWLGAAEVNMKVIPLDGKPAYLIQVGDFSERKAAEEFKVKLDAALNLTSKIEAHANQFILQLSPLNDYAQARTLEQKINQLPELKQSAASSSEATSTNLSEDKIWNLRNADIRAVIAEVSRVTGKNFLIDPRVQGKISIVSASPMSDKELYQVFLSMLQVSGYAAIPSGQVIKIIPNADAKVQVIEGGGASSQKLQGDDMMVLVVPVHYVPSDQLVPVLRPLMPPWSNVSSYNPSNMLILSGRASNVKELAEIIKQVDNSSSNGIDIVPLRHALAMDVLSTLKELVKTPVGVGSLPQTNIAADDRSNAILLSGSKTERIRLRLLIAELDKKNPNANNGNTQVVYLNYLRAEDVVPILAGIAQASFSGNVGTTIGTITRPELDSTNPSSNLANMSPNNSNAPSSTPSQAANPNANPNTSGASTQNEGSTKPTVQIIAEPNTNSIIINAPATLIRTLKTVINQLDIRPAQLLIEAMVVEINESDFNSLGVEWGSIDQKTKNPEAFRPGFAIINSKTSIQQFQAQIYALARLHKANILSTPSVVVLDNRQAKILIGKQVSVASSSYPNNANATTTASPFTTFDRVNVALHLYVRPQITRAMGIQMQIDQGNDTLDSPNPVEAGTTPTFNISSIVTAVHVESGDIVVLGGLAQDSLGNDNNGIPILSGIPGLGRLFQHNTTSHEKKVLMVFIRPCILRNERDSLQVTGGKYDDLRRYQLEWMRNQQYNRRNKLSVLPPLHIANLPKPFHQAPQLEPGATR